MSQYTQSIQAAISVFSDGLAALEERVESADMDAALGQVVEVLLGMSGRLIVTGLGKSGHVGTKLAATFSSTGTPAYFVHPAEASHGDLGVIQSDDVVLMLSWSGETGELSDLTAYTRRFGVPLVLMTGNAQSTLAQSADIVLALPSVQEACPHNLAPTTSSLLQHALGDAIAVSLLKARGFSEDSFHAFHPAGRLTASLKRVSEIMVTGEELPLLSEQAPVIDVVTKLSARGYGIVGVLDAQGALIGVVTDGDIRRYLESQFDRSMQEALHDRQALSVMTRNPVSLSADRLAARALGVMQSRAISAAFVLENGKPIGLITMLGLLNAGVA